MKIFRLKTPLVDDYWLHENKTVLQFEADIDEFVALFSEENNWYNFGDLLYNFLADHCYVRVNDMLEATITCDCLERDKLEKIHVERKERKPAVEEILR